MLSSFLGQKLRFKGKKQLGSLSVALGWENGINQSKVHVLQTDQMSLGGNYPPTFITLPYHVMICLCIQWHTQSGQEQINCQGLIPSSNSGHSGMDGGPRCNLHRLGRSRYCKDFPPGFQLALEIRSTFVSGISSLLYETVREQSCRKPSTSIQPTRSLTSTELSAPNQKP